MKFTTLPALALLLGLLPASAGPPETARERGKRVVYQALEAIGGKAFLAMQDRVETGRLYTFYQERLQGLSVATIYTRYLAPVPGKVSVRERQNYGKDQYAGVLFNEEGAWEITFRGARPLEQTRIDAYQDSTLRNVFYILRQRLDEPGMDFYSPGADRYENQPVDVVDITDTDNRTVTVNFNQLTHLPVRQVFRRRNPQFKDFDTEETFFAKYRDLGGGVKWPENIRRQRNGERIYEMYSEKVEINKNLKDDLFTLPAKITILPPAK
jgi:hypothetical protein